MRIPPTARAERLTLRQRFEFRAVRLLLSLPAAVQLRLSGRPPVVIGGRTLHPQMQLLLALHERWRGTNRALPVVAARQEFRSDALAISGQAVGVGAVADLTIDGGAGAVNARHYAPPGSGHRPLLVYFHGGGFVQGDIDTHDSLCRRICRHGDIHLLSVEYRLAPENPFPAAVDDAFAAFQWACAHARDLGATPDTVAVGGDSAGANLAAVVCQKAVAARAPAPCAQVLLYPALDRTIVRPSQELFGEGFFLTNSNIEWYQLQYTGTTVAQPNPAQYPLCADSFAGLAPALIVTAGFDPLCDEGEAYADVLRRAGVRVILRRFDGLLHGFCSMASLSPVCEAALHSICTDLGSIINSEPSAA